MRSAYPISYPRSAASDYVFGRFEAARNEGSVARSRREPVHRREQSCSVAERSSFDFHNPRCGFSAYQHRTPVPINSAVEPLRHRCVLRTGGAGQPSRPSTARPKPTTPCRSTSCASAASPTPAFPPAGQAEQLPPVDAATVLLRCDDTEFARRCRSIADAEGLTMLEHIVVQID